MLSRIIARPAPSRPQTRDSRLLYAQFVCGLSRPQMPNFKPSIQIMSHVDVAARAERVDRRGLCDRCRRACARQHRSQGRHARRALATATLVLMFIYIRPKKRSGVQCTCAFGCCCRRTALWRARSSAGAAAWASGAALRVPPTSPTRTRPTRAWASSTSSTTRDSSTRASLSSVFLFLFPLTEMLLFLHNTYD